MRFFVSRGTITAMLAFLALASAVPDISPMPVRPDGQSGGNIVLDAAVFVIGVGLLGGILFWITKKILIDEKY